MASKAKQAKIVVCTDGLANVGLGNVDNIPVGRRTAAQEQLAQV